MSASPSVTMDTTYAMAPQPSFAYYPTDPTSQRQHTHYPSHPSEMQQPYYGQMHAFPQSQHHHHHPQQPQPQPQHGLPDQQQALYAAQPMMNMHQMATTNAFRGAINMTPIASPQPSQLKPTIIVQPGSSGLMPLDTRFVSADFYGFPSTPPLSASGSSISSSSSSPPSSTGAQHTPISENFLSFEKVEGVKEGCEGEVHTEILAHPEWTRSESPPMTPVFIHPPSLIASQTSDLLSANGSCPSLSPSPSPVSSNFDAQAHAALVSQSQSALPVEPAGAHFCDPRELTVESTVSGAAASDLPPLPTLACEEEDPKSALDNAAAVTLPVHENPSPTFAPGSTEDALNVLPTFDSFSDLDSEDEFVNRLVDFHPSGNAFFLGDKRQRVGNYGLEEDGFLSEHSLEEEDAVAHPGYASVEGSDLAGAHHCHGEHQAEEMGSKKQRSNSRKPIKRSSTSSESSDDGKKVQAVNTRANNSQASTGAQHSHHVERQVSEVSTASGAEAAPPVSVNRRGRKQSLTDDPSKTFVCTLCSRRFRRQEHLKRHYRSLHTQDKPFECNECGKKFSRSDNLAQHARTHGGQSVVMGVMDSGEAAAHASYDEHDPNALGAVLYEAANATAVKSATSESSEDGSSGTSRSSNKKRKRDENAA